MEEQVKNSRYKIGCSVGPKMFDELQAMIGSINNKEIELVSYSENMDISDINNYIFDKSADVDKDLINKLKEQNSTITPLKEFMGDNTKINEMIELIGEKRCFDVSCLP